MGGQQRPLRIIQARHPAANESSRPPPATPPKWFSSKPLSTNYLPEDSINIDGLSGNRKKVGRGFDKFGHLFYKDTFSHYFLRVEYRFVDEQIKGGPAWAVRNNGLMIHGQDPSGMKKDQKFPVSIEVQLLGGNGTDDRSTLNLCTPGTNVVLDGELFQPHCTNSHSKTYHGDEWVTAEIEVRGNQVIRHRIDGEVVLEYTNPQYDPIDREAKPLIVDGNLMIDRGTISLQSESHPTEFRKIELKDLSIDQASNQAVEQPNIVLLFVDDLGWYDLGYRNPKFETPNIDHLAAESIDFTQCYVASPTCSPSRATLLTGKHPARLRMVRHIPSEPKHGFDKFGRTNAEFHFWETDPAQFPSRNWLPLEHTTYAEALGEFGYHNIFFGKWHLGHEPFHPIHQGFDKQTGTTNAGHPNSYRPPFFKHSEVFADQKEGYLTDRLTDEAIGFLASHSKKGSDPLRSSKGSDPFLKSPFMLSMWFYNVHRPPVGRPDLIEHFLSKGYEQSAAVYAAQVKAVDESVGRIRKSLADQDLAENTIVIFVSDQGSWYGNAPLRGTKRVDTLCEGGARVPMLVHWPGVTKPGTTNDSIVQTTDLFPTLVEIAGGDPARYADLDGVSLVSTLRESTTLQRGSPIFGYRAYEDLYASVREGDWKLLAYRSGKSALYNIANDPKENQNLAASNPDIAKRLTAKLIAWEKHVGVEEFSGVQ